MLPGLLDSALLQSGEAALNRVLACDPVTLARLARLEGRCLQVELAPVGPRLYLFPHRRGIQLQRHSQAQADATLRLSHLQLLQLARAAAREEPLPAGALQLRGDSGLVQALREILTSVRIDWEGLLADYLGDLGAHALARGARSTDHYLRSSAHQAQADLRRYLIDELELLPDQQELEMAAGQIEELRADCDRLAARVARLAAQASA